MTTKTTTKTNKKLSAKDAATIRRMVAAHDGIDLATTVKAGKGSPPPYPVKAGRSVGWYRQVPVFTPAEGEGGFAHHGIAVVKVKAPRNAKAVLAVLA